MTNSEVYYKLYNIRGKYLTIVCLQWFDEYDYDQSRFFKSDGEILIFSEEDEAIDYLNFNFDKEDIDPKYYRVKKRIINSEILEEKS